jgi:hypothetical protein
LGCLEVNTTLGFLGFCGNLFAVGVEFRALRSGSLGSFCIPVIFFRIFSPLVGGVSRVAVADLRLDGIIASLDLRIERRTGVVYAVGVVCNGK